MLSNIYLIIYALAWVFLFIYYKKKSLYFGAGNVLLLLYIFFSCASLILFNRQDFVMGQSEGWEKLYLLPLVYLFGALWFTSTPILNYDRSKVNQIVSPNYVILDIVAITVVFTSVWSVLTRWDYIVQGLAMIIINVDNAADLYADKVDVYERLSLGLKGANIFVLFLHYIYTLFHDFNVLLFFYYLTLPQNSKNRLFAFLLGLGTFFEILFSISLGNRTGIMLPILTIIFTYFVFSRFYSQNVKKKIGFASAIGGGVFVLFFSIITISRFSNFSSGINGSVVFYAGQANLNFDVYAFDNGGIRNGDRTMMLFKGWFDKSTPSDRQDLLAKYPKLKITDGLFSTYIGDIMIDFGPILATLIFLIFTLIMNRITRPKGTKLYFDQMIWLFFVICICSRGCMYLFDFSLKGGNWRIVGFMLLYLLFHITRIERNNPKVFIKQY